MCCFLADFPEISSYFPLDFIPLDSIGKNIQYVILDICININANFVTVAGSPPKERVNVNLTICSLKEDFATVAI